MTSNAAIPSMSLVPSEEEQAVREAVAQIGAKFGHSYFVEKTRAGLPTDELWAALGEAGFLGVSLPEEYGGGGGGLWDLAIVAEELAAAGTPMQALVYSQSMSGSILAKYGTHEQKDYWLRGIASGELKFSFAITESDAGSNSQNLSMTAREEGDKFVLNGSKTFISGVEFCDAIMVVARTGTHESTGKGLLSIFIVRPDEVGLEKQHLPTAVEAPDSQWTLFFDNVVLDRERLVGEWNGGFKAIFEGLNPERVLASVFCTGIGRYALQKASRYVKEREVWGVPIGSHQGVAHPLAEAKIHLELARNMTERAARMFDAGLPCGETANMAKFAASDAGIAALDSAIQVHGGNGVALEYGLTDMWWLVRVLTIAPVSREMVLNFVAEHTLGLPRTY